VEIFETNHIRSNRNSYATPSHYHHQQKSHYDNTSSAAFNGYLNKTSAIQRQPNRDLHSATDTKRTNSENTSLRPVAVSLSNSAYLHSPRQPIDASERFDEFPFEDDGEHDISNYLNESDDRMITNRSIMQNINNNMTVMSSASSKSYQRHNNKIFDHDNIITKSVHNVRKAKGMPRIFRLCVASGPVIKVITPKKFSYI
jgi:hypothetical protein